MDQVIFSKMPFLDSTLNVIPFWQNLKFTKWAKRWPHGLVVAVFREPQVGLFRVLNVAGKWRNAITSVIDSLASFRDLQVYGIYRKAGWLSCHGLFLGFPPWRLLELLCSAYGHVWVADKQPASGLKPLTIKYQHASSTITQVIGLSSYRGLPRTPNEHRNLIKFLDQLSDCQLL